MKNLWFIRNSHRLFRVLSYSICGLVLVYTILSLIFADGFKITLLIIPLVQVAICIANEIFYRNIKTSRNVRNADKELLQQHIAFAQDSNVGFIFITMLFTSFVQLDLTNKFKNITGSYLIFTIASLIALVIYTIYRAAKFKKIK